MAALGFPFDPNSVARLCSYGNFPDIPAIQRLKRRRQWVCWRYEDHGKPKLDKVPYQPGTGFRASVTKPTHWGTYDQAVARAARGKFDGIGFVLSDDDDLTGIDLDHCRDPDTGTLEPLAQRVADLAETYCEVTPSETGLRLIVEGKVAAALKRDPVGVEIYGRGRYLTITGWHLPNTPIDVRPANATLAALREAVEAFDAANTARQKETTTTSPGQMAVAPLPDRDENGSPFFRNVNTAALASLTSWVPAIFGPAARWAPGTGGYRVSSKSLGRNLEEDLSIVPGGIRDFGVGDMGDARLGARTPIDLVLEYGFERDVLSAARWLCQQLGRSPEHYGWHDAPNNGAEIAEGLLAARSVIKTEDGDLADAETGELLVPLSNGPGAILDELPYGRGVQWDHPTGLLGAIADWILASSRRPNRPLAVAAATATISAVCGRHLFGPTGSSLNLYIVSIASSTVGKNRPLSAVSELLRAAKLDMLHSTAKGFSVSAIEQMMVEHPACVATIDEIGANLFGRMSHRNSNTHEMAMRGALLELWSREKGMAPFSTHRRANANPVDIASPSLTLFGASTADAFYGALTSGSVKDGFMNRFLLAHAGPRSKTIEVSDEARRVPGSIIARIHDLIPEARGNLGNALGVFSLNVDPEGSRLVWDRGTKEKAEAFEEAVLQVMDDNPEAAPLLGRVFETSVRLASICAVSRDGRSAEVCSQDLHWGAAWAISSARAMLDGAGMMMAANDYEQKFNAVRNAIRTAGSITRQDLLRRVRSVSAREREDIIKHLREGGWIENITIPTTGRHAAGWRWLG